MGRSDRRKRNNSSTNSDKSVPSFLSKTYDIIENPEYRDIICWNHDGTAFIVKKVTEFSEIILPKYFKHNNFSSFVRQLNMYDFHKTKGEGNESEFRHRYFLQGQKHLLGNIKRKISEGPIATQQLVPYDKIFDIDRVKRDCVSFSKDLASLKTRQMDLEKVSQTMFEQNNQLIQENKLLWSELKKSKDKYEKKMEKLMMFVFSIMNPSQHASIAADFSKGNTNEIGTSDLNNTLQVRDGGSEGMLNKLLTMLKSKDNTTADPLLQNKDFINDMLKDPSFLNQDDSMIESTDLNHMEEPKRKKGRPRKLKAIMDEPSISTDLSKKLKNDNNSDQYNVYSLPPPVVSPKPEYSFESPAMTTTFTEPVDIPIKSPMLDVDIGSPSAFNLAKIPSNFEYYDLNPQPYYSTPIKEDIWKPKLTDKENVSEKEELGDYPNFLDFGSNNKITNPVRLPSPGIFRENSSSKL